MPTAAEVSAAPKRTAKAAHGTLRKLIRDKSFARALATLGD
jgi:hypothetical protein